MLYQTAGVCFLVLTLYVVGFVILYLSRERLCWHRRLCILVGRVHQGVSFENSRSIKYRGNADPTETDARMIST